MCSAVQWFVHGVKFIQLLNSKKYLILIFFVVVVELKKKEMMVKWAFFKKKKQKLFLMSLFCKTKAWHPLVRLPNIYNFYPSVKSSNFGLTFFRDLPFLMNK